MSEKTGIQKAYVLVDIFFKISTPLALAALFFLKSQFVTKEQYEKDRVFQQEQMHQIQVTLKLMAEQNRVNDRQDTVLADHEQRIRNLERRN